MSSSRITFEGLGNLYRFFLFDRRDGTATAQLILCLQKFSEIEQGSQEQQKDKLREAVSSLISVHQKILADYKDAGPHYVGSDREVRRFHTAGLEALTQIKEMTRETLAPLIKKIMTVVRERFDQPAQVQEKLQTEATRQNDIIRYTQSEAMQFCTGLAGFYEIVFKRPYLQYTQANQGRSMDFIKSFPGHLDKVIRSFPEQGGLSQGEGGVALRSIIRQVAAHRDSLAPLYAPESEAEFFIGRLIAIKDDQQAQQELYDSLRKTVLDGCKKKASAMDQISGEQVRAFFDEKAADIADALPDSLKAPNRAVAATIVNAFTKQQEHGQGALISGQLGLTHYQSQLFGEGINWGAVHDIPVNPFSELNLDSLSRTAKEAFKRHANNIVFQYYQNHLLNTTCLIAHGNSVIEENEITDPILHALTTVNSVIRHELAQYRREHLIIGELEPRQIENLTPQMAKKVVLFGIQHDMFSRPQCLALCRQYPSLASDPDITTAALESYGRFRARQTVEEKSSS